MQRADSTWPVYLVTCVISFMAVDRLAWLIGTVATPAKRVRNLEILRYCAAASFMLTGLLMQLTGPLHRYTLSFGYNPGLFDLLRTLLGIANITLVIFSLYPLMQAMNFVYVSWAHATKLLAPWRLARWQRYFYVGLLSVGFYLSAFVAASFTSEFVREFLGKRVEANSIGMQPISCLVTSDGRVSAVVRLRINGDKSSDVVLPIDSFRATIIRSREKTQTHALGLSIVRADIPNESLFVVLSGGTTHLVHLVGSLVPANVPWPLADVGTCKIEPVAEAALISEFSFSSDVRARFVAPPPYQPPSKH